MFGILIMVSSCMNKHYQHRRLDKPYFLVVFLPTYILARRPCSLASLPQKKPGLR